MVVDLKVWAMPPKNSATASSTVPRTKRSLMSVLGHGEGRRRRGGIGQGGGFEPGLEGPGEFGTEALTVEGLKDGFVLGARAEPALEHQEVGRLELPARRRGAGRLHARRPGFGVVRGLLAVPERGLEAHPRCHGRGQRDHRGGADLDDPDAIEACAHGRIPSSSGAWASGANSCMSFSRK
jgi:hypothetical protein